MSHNPTETSEYPKSNNFPLPKHNPFLKTNEDETINESKFIEFIIDWIEALYYSIPDEDLDEVEQDLKKCLKEGMFKKMLHKR